MNGNDDERSALVDRAWALQASGKHHEAIDAYTQLLRIREIPDLYNQRGLAFAAVGNAKAAFDDYARGLALDPADPELLTNRGNAYLRSGDYAAAIADYDAALATDGSQVFAHAYNGRGWARWKRGETNAAIRDFKAAIQANREYAAPYYNLAIVMVARKRSEKALPYLDRAVQLAPDDVSTLCFRSDVLQYLFRSSEALDDCVRAHRADPNDPEPRWRIAWLRSTCDDPSVLRDGKNAYEHAVAACEATNWTNPRGLKALAAACAECGRFQEAVKWQERVVALSEGTDQQCAREDLARLKDGKPLRVGGSSEELLEAIEVFLRCEELSELVDEVIETLESNGRSQTSGE